MLRNPKKPDSIKPLKFVYFTPIDIQLARVDRQCIVYFCEALHRMGVDIEMITLGIRVFNTELKADHPLELYRIKEKFPVKIVPTLLHQKHQYRGKNFWTDLNRAWVHISQAIRLLFSNRKANKQLIFYVKNYLSTLAFQILQFFGKNKSFIVFEIHTLPRGKFQQFILRKVDAVIANSHLLEKDLIENDFVNKAKVIGTHQGVSMDLYDEYRISREKAREKLGLPLNKKLAVYTGKVAWGYKEVDYIVEATRHLPEEFETIIVGGRPNQIELFNNYIKSNNITNVTFTGFVSPDKIPYYQFAADLLLLYYPSGIDINRYRSPGKLFEYMAADRPIVAVDIPVLREVLGKEPTAVMVSPDSPMILGEAILKLFSDNEKAENMANLALSRVRQYTWEARAKTIIGFINKLINDNNLPERRKSVSIK